MCCVLNGNCAVFKKLPAFLFGLNRNLNKWKTKKQYVYVCVCVCGMNLYSNYSSKLISSQGSSQIICAYLSVSFSIKQSAELNWTFIERLFSFYLCVFCFVFHFNFVWFFFSILKTMPKYTSTYLIHWFIAIWPRFTRSAKR